VVTLIAEFIRKLEGAYWAEYPEIHLLSLLIHLPLKYMGVVIVVLVKDKEHGKYGTLNPSPLPRRLECRPGIRRSAGVIHDAC
jgi:hypothetical protein